MLENLKRYKIILGSNSPRRKELLSGLDIPFTVLALPGIDESYPDSIDPEFVPEYIAKKKASAYMEIMEKDTLLITADTIVCTIV